jgi:surfeit locus 1 family protein
MTVGNRVFAPRTWPAAVTLLVLAGCVSLGCWQIGRGREKRELLEAFARGTQTTIDLSGRDIDEMPRYQHVRVSGHYRSDHQVLIDNMPAANGAAGYRVLTPLERADGHGIVLVDRGWVPMGLTRARLPDVTVGDEPRAVRGRLDTLPVPGIRVGDANVAGDERWPRVLLFPTVADLEETLGRRVASRIVLLDDDLPDGYERVWRPSIGFGPERHLGYALQWFALGIAAAVAFVATSLRRDEPESGGVR